MPIEIVKAEGKLIKKYIDFPHDLYADDPNYVPELYMAQKDIFNRKKNPFYKNAEVEHFLAYRDGKIVGRITAFDNKRYNVIHKSNVGFFGFFDLINDAEVCKVLIEKATSWCKERGFDAIIGPFSYSLNDTAGLLVKGFDEPPKIMMTYNQPYYKELLEDYGFKKDMDLFAYILYTKKASEKSIRLAQALERRLANQGITIRNINMKKI